MDQHLANGSRVCIVGGGPAGSFAALHLLDQAARHGLQLEVLIFEPRDFTRPGPTGCNRCAGILSSRLIAGVEALGVILPRRADPGRRTELRGSSAGADGAYRTSEPAAPHPQRLSRRWATYPARVAASKL